MFYQKKRCLVEKYRSGNILRFPRATSQPRANRTLVIKALPQGGAILAFEPFALPAGSSLVAFPAGQGRLRQRYIARRKSAFLFRGVYVYFLH
ncbi:hypothetical protein D8M04_07190 [Oceanobacillus piezotolerans]|uniref:Uncharacterized protein n=1 Tax=Oceanobacillus piezotolerans TaxID=2448030 RepID=A0A498DKG2_9BACI|nr:hypothetical protein D8M04_07190 [Oceanobacillus piezotolerans]